MCVGVISSSKTTEMRCEDKVGVSLSFQVAALFLITELNKQDVFKFKAKK